MDYIFIDRKEDEIRSGVIENGRLLEYHVDFETSEDLLGNIYRARVINVLKGINSAFIDIGDKINAYLPYRELYNRDSKDTSDIGDYIKGGETLLVEVKKEKTGDKGAVVSTNISIKGKYISITPYKDKILVSKKIKNKEEIDRLNELGENLKINGIGLEFRPAAIGKNLNYLKKEYDYLIKEFKQVDKNKDFLPIPKVLYKEPNIAFRMVRDLFKPGKYEIRVNDKDIYDEILHLNDYFNLDLERYLKLDKKYDSSLDHLVQKDLIASLNQEILLKNGGSIVIEETEALVSIDVNTKGYTGNISQEETNFNTNMEAAVEIARQIRLQNLSGIIIVDFIRMNRDSNVSKLIDKLKYSMMDDRNRPYIIGLTRLGLLELTRKRETDSLSQILAKECSQCRGRGIIRK